MGQIFLFFVVLLMSNIIAYKTGAKKQRRIANQKRKLEREAKWKAERDMEDGLNAVEIAAKRINEAIPLDCIPREKEFKLASLVVMDQDEIPSIEDHLLIDSEGNVRTLSEFREDDRNVDWILDYWECLNSITSNLYHEVIDDVSRYSAFEDALNNCYGGRHGKDKIAVKDAFVCFVDLTRTELEVIANHTDDDIFMKRYESQESLTYAEDRKRHKKFMRDVHLKDSMLEVEMLINKTEMTINSLSFDANVDAYLAMIDDIQHEYYVAYDIPNCIDSLDNIKTFYANKPTIPFYQNVYNPKNDRKKNKGGKQYV